MERKKTVSIVTPMYNETDVVDVFFEKINSTTEELKDFDFEIVVVNDGSRDDTLEKLQKHLTLQKNLKVVNLSRNFGQEPAVFAGVDNATGDAIIVMDADLQDPPELIGQMIEKWQQGFDVVNAKRTDRKVDSKLQRNTAKFYYKTLNSLSYKVKYPENVNNFRLITRRVVEVIKAFPSNEKLFRNAVAQAGFKTAEIEFARQPRQGGKSKVNIKSMLRLSFQGIADASVKPLNVGFVWSIIFGSIGGLFSLFAGVLLILNDCSVDFAQNVCDLSFFTGLAIFFLFMFFTGIIMLLLSINGFYLGKAYTELKGRPMYIIERVYKSE